MDAVSRELTSLKLCLESLRDDARNDILPKEIQQNISAIVRNCDRVAKEIADLLQKLSSANLGRRMQWTLSAREEVDKLRQSLESHKSAIAIALDMSAM